MSAITEHVYILEAKTCDALNCVNIIEHRLKFEKLTNAGKTVALVEFKPCFGNEILLRNIIPITKQTSLIVVGMSFREMRGLPTFENVIEDLEIFGWVQIVYKEILTNNLQGSVVKHFPATDGNNMIECFPKERADDFLILFSDDDELSPCCLAIQKTALVPILSNPSIEIENSYPQDKFPPFSFSAYEQLSTAEKQKLISNSACQEIYVLRARTEHVSNLLCQIEDSIKTIAAGWKNICGEVYRDKWIGLLEPKNIIKNVIAIGDDKSLIVIGLDFIIDVFVNLGRIITRLANDNNHCFVIQSTTPSSKLTNKTMVTETGINQWIPTTVKVFPFYSDPLTCENKITFKDQNIADYFILFRGSVYDRADETIVVIEKRHLINFVHYPSMIEKNIQEKFDPIEIAPLLSL